MTVVSYGGKKTPTPADARGIALGLAIAGCICAIVAAALPMWMTLGLNDLPRGTMIRPMGLGVLVLLCQIGALMTAVPLILGALYLGWRSRLVWVLALCTLLLIPVPILGTKWLSNRIIAQRGLIVGN